MVKRTEPRFWSYAGQKHHLAVRRSVQSTIRSHAGQKDRFVIFSHGAPKMGKKSWRETLRTTGVKFRSESEVSSGTLQPKCRDGTLQSATTAHQTRWVKVENFDQERVFRFGPIRQWSPSRIFYPFWATHGRKIRIGLFDHRVTKWCF